MLWEAYFIWSSGEKDDLTQHILAWRCKHISLSSIYTSEPQRIESGFRGGVEKERTRRRQSSISDEHIYDRSRVWI